MSASDRKGAPCALPGAANNFDQAADNDLPKFYSPPTTTPPPIPALRSPPITPRTAPIESCNTSLHRVSVKAPPFYTHDPVLWFANIEAQFEYAGIKADETKYYFIVSVLDPQVSTHVRDIVIKPPSSDKYNAVKTRLTQLFGQSDQQRLTQLLSGMELGGRKPSQLLSEMYSLGGDAIGEEALRTIWMKSLPPQCTSVLAVADCELRRQAIMADRILECTPGYSGVASIADPSMLATPAPTIPQPQYDALQQQINMLADKLADTRFRDRPYRHRDFSRRRSRSSSRPRNSPNHERPCYYHARFGENARKCRSPCSFKRQKN